MNLTTCTFKELDGNTMFTALNFWEETEVQSGVTQTFVRMSLGVWSWQQVKSVLEMFTPNTFGEYGITGPMTVLNWNDGFIHLLADYQTVQAAWRRYRQQYKPQLHFSTPN